MGSHHLRVILLNLVDHLSENDRERLRFYIGPDVPRIIRDDSSFAGILRLWESLFDQDKINEEDFTYLINALDEIHCRDAVKLLRGYFLFLINVLIFFVHLEHMRRMQTHGLKESLENLASIIPPTAPHITIEEILGDQDKDDKLALKSQSSKTTFDGIWLKPGNGKIPSDAVVGGQEGNKLVYIARSKLVNNCIIPGKLVEGTEKAIITHFGVHSSSNYEVLIRSNPEQEFKWSATRNAIVPEGALVAGKEEAVLVYVGRIHYNSTMILLGKHVVPDGTFYYAHDGHEINNDPSFNLDLTTFNFDDQLNSMDVYPTTFDEPFQEVIYINKQSLNFNTTIDIQEEQINQFVEIDEETNEDE
ncbi:unnamed protein product [Rotaria sp. Silwood1]|nr:unnamed protein product [Rotaria sp. Silwood1]